MRRKKITIIEQKKILKRLEKELEEIQAKHFYGDEDLAYSDFDFYYLKYILKQRKDALIRSLVLRDCLFIEDLLTHKIKSHLLKNNPRIKSRKKYLVRSTKSTSLRYLDLLLEGDLSIGLRKKIDLARGMGLIDRGTYEQILEINKVRNKCAHNFDLEGVVRRYRKRKGKKPYILTYKNKNLYDKQSLKQFMDDCSKVIFSFVDLPKNLR